MARKRVSENPVVVSGAAAAVPARRKTAVRRTSRPPVEAAEVQVEQSVVEVAAEPIIGVPSPEEIARLAYTFWLDRGCQGGSPEEDWLRAEQQLIALSAR